MKLNIHRGAHTIGGTCIEIRSADSRIILDLGMPLMDKEGKGIDEEKLKNPSVDNGILPDVQGIYKDHEPSVDAIILSHAHLDHSGLLNHLHPLIPVYMSAGSKSLLDIGKIFYPADSRIHIKDIQTFDHWKPFQVGPFKITSYLADHSGFDASSFLVEAEGKKIFYTGDFRGHGRKAKVLNSLTVKPIPDIDCLLMEGTNLGGNYNVGFNTEEAVENKFKEIFSRQKDASFVIASGSNIDRIVSIYKATIKSKKTLVLDLYTYYVLEQLKAIASLPPYMNDNIRILYLKGHAQNIADNISKDVLYRYVNRKIEVGEIVDNRKNMVLKLPISGLRKIADKLIIKQPLEHAKFIFSMWPGYLDMDNCYHEFCAKYKTELVKVHVSGHAFLADLKRLSEALNPKMLIPIHTLSADNFDNHFNNVTQFAEGKPFEV